MNLKKIIWLLLFVNAGLFLTLLFCLGFVQKPVADDLIFQQLVQEFGIWESTMMMRDEWNPRWMAVLLNQTLHATIPENVLGLIYQSITVTLGLIAFNPISKLLTPATKAGVMRFIISVNLLFGLFLLSFGHSDSWFWMCSQPAYLWAALVSFWIVSHLFNENQKRWMVPILILAHIYVGGSSELIAVSLVLVEISILLFRKQLPPINIKYLIICLSTLLGALIFSLSGQGVENRYNFLNPPSLGGGLVIGLKSYLNVLFYGLGSKLPFVFMFACVLYSIRSEDRSYPLLDWKIPFAVADGLLVCTLLMTAFTLGEIGPNRALIHISTTVLGLLALLVILSKRSDKYLTNIRNMAIVFSLFFSGFLIYHLALSIPQDIGHSNAVTKRRAHISDQIKNGATTIYLDRLPEPRFLFNAKISTDPLHQNNKQLSTIYGDDIQFVLQP